MLLECCIAMPCLHLVRHGDGGSGCSRTVCAAVLLQLTQPPSLLASAGDHWSSECDPCNASSLVAPSTSVYCSIIPGCGSHAGQIEAVMPDSLKHLAPAVSTACRPERCEYYPAHSFQVLVAQPVSCCAILCCAVPRDAKKMLQPGRVQNLNKEGAFRYKKMYADPASAKVCACPGTKERALKCMQCIAVHAPSQLAQG
jgi:hypothetical protein